MRLLGVCDYRPSHYNRGGRVDFGPLDFKSPCVWPVQWAGWQPPQEIEFRFNGRDDPFLVRDTLLRMIEGAHCLTQSWLRLR